MNPLPRPYWTVLPPMMPARVLADLAAGAEGQGIAGIFAPQVYGPPFTTLAALATRTTRVQLGSGIAIAFTRSPFETAMAAIDLDRISEGRFVLGLGTSTKVWVEQIFGERFSPPGDRLYEVCQIVREVIAKLHTGEMKGFEGRHYRLDFSEIQPSLPPVRAQVPIWIAALRKGLIERAAGYADGLIGHPMWSVAWATEQVPGYIEEGLARAGRRRSDLHVNQWHWVAIDDDREAALADAKKTVASYAQHPQYASYYEHHGFGKVARALHESVHRDGLDQAAADVPDEMAEIFVRLGSAESVRKEVEALWRCADSLTLVPPIYCAMDRQLAYLSRIAETFYSAPGATASGE